jgi:hypothetical protein
MSELELFCTIPLQIQVSSESRGRNFKKMFHFCDRRGAVHTDRENLQREGGYLRRHENFLR